MPVTRANVRSGAYYDSVVLMQLQRSLAALPGVVDAGVVMGTEANKEILAQSDLLVVEARAAGADDLVIVVKADDQAAADAALEQVDGLLSRRRSSVEQDYLPKSLDSATDMLPEAQWVLVSVPGRYAAGVARQALDLGRHVFLYSDNVSVEDEVSLKRTAAEKGLLVMGPDCGTAIVNGTGLGFANEVRPGPIGLVAASGTGLQQVSSRIHQLGGGVTHALGTGGRDLSEAVGAITAHQALDLLSRDPETKVIVLVSKPPAQAVAGRLLAAARAAGKPVVVDLIGYRPVSRQVDNLHFVDTFDQAAELAVRLVGGQGAAPSGAAGVGIPPSLPPYFAPPFTPGQRYLRGLFSGGTLAYEALLILRDYFPAVYSNVPLRPDRRLENPMVSREHTIVDLGEDVFTVGRLHPMMDNDLRIRRLKQEAEDPGVALILLDVVLGYGAHPDPASELAPAIAGARVAAQQAGRHLEVIAVVVGTDEDPQDMAAQVARLEEAGAAVFTSNEEAVRAAAWLLGAVQTATTRGGGESLVDVEPPPKGTEVALDVLNQPLAGINVGVES
ncbi:MAG TPA: acyl-CoA synthetase FdrA, partial [Anaerolineae bacterium]|nr:acyl-CoA synthetase FdrA [Anaerolineae bacterium]